MFGFFGSLFGKKEGKSEALTQREEGHRSDNGAGKIAVGSAVNQVARGEIQKANQKYAKPQTYDRKAIDSGAAKRNAKMKAFSNGHKPIDPYTKAELELTIRNAKAMYGQNWAKHLAETDHTIALHKLYERVKDETWNTQGDIRSALNSPDNLSVTSRSFNNAKRDRSNKEFVQDEEYLKKTGVELTEEGKRQAIEDERLALESIDQQLMEARTKNVLDTVNEAGVAGAQYAGVTSLTMSGINNVAALLNGEISSEEAIANVAVDSGKAALDGYVMSGGLTVLGHQLSSSSSDFVRGLAEANVPGKVVAAVMVTGDTLARWGSGEITTQECMIELGDKGLNMATMGYFMTIGQAAIPIPIVGGAIGAMVGSTLTSGYYQELIELLKNRELKHQERMRMIEESERAAEETRQFNEQLKEYRDQYFAEYHEFFDTTLSTMKFAYETGDADGVIHAANKITEKLGGKVQYETVDEFEDFLDSDEPFVL